MTDYNTFILSNNIQVVYKHVPFTKIVHCGITLDIGSRDEMPHQHGIAHFWEHMAFKGTKKRKSFHIINRLETVGGELNAFTTKEKVCFYASVLDQHVEKAIELLADITFQSIFPDKQIEKERSVIIEEMNLYHDNPEEAIHDEIDELVFSDHPIGKNILGTPESVNTFKKQDVENFLKENLNTKKVVFSLVGNISSKRIQYLIDKHLSSIAASSAYKKRAGFSKYKPQKRITYRDVSQAYCILGKPAYSLHSNKRLAFILLTNLLGGPAMSSRLNLSLREKYGYVYEIEANYTSYIDTGMFSINFATEAKHLDRSLTLVKRELEKLKGKLLGKLQLHYAKEQLIGQLAMAEENNTSLMLMLAKSLLDLKRIDSLESIFKQIRNISASDLQEIAEEMFDFDQFSVLTLLPRSS